MEPLKEALNENFIAEFIQDISSFYKKDKNSMTKSFYANVNWKDLSLKERIKHSSDFIYEVNNRNFLSTLPFLNEVSQNYRGLQGMIFPTVVEHYGLEHFDESMETLHWITRFSTGEFAIRPFILKCEESWNVLKNWSEDENEHVRRLSSEGCRPLLPWGLQLKPLVKNPTPIFPILENLFYDSSEYVRKSVANNLNDISKNQPQQVKTFVQKFDDDHAHQKRIIAHGLRTLLKKGDAEAYPIIGYSPNAKVNVESQVQKKKVKSQCNQIVDVQITNLKKDKTPVFINLIVYYPRQNGNHLRKVFLLKKATLKGNEKIEMQKTISFKDLSTRKHYSGEHHLAIQVNGKEYPRQSFQYQS